MKYKEKYLAAMAALDEAITYIDAITGGGSRTLDELIEEYERLEGTE